MNYYKILELDRNPTEKQIRDAYRRLSMIYHPDKNPGKEKECEEKFKEISEAYQILSDPEKRQIYDQYGHQGLQGGVPPGQGGFNPFDIFSQMFGGFSPFGQPGFPPPPGSKGKTRTVVQEVLECSLADSFLGNVVVKQFQFEGPCPSCDGSGTDKPELRTSCGPCGGRGVMTQVQNLGHMRIQQQIQCPHCGGKGSHIPDDAKCGRCKGKGESLVEPRFELRLPRGIRDGEVIREMDRNIEYRFIVKVKEHPEWTRIGDDLHYRHRISLWDALMGRPHQITLINGEQLSIVPEPGEVIHHKKKRIFKGKGMPVPLTSDRGDLVISYRIRYPDSIPDELRMLIQNL